MQTQIPLDDTSQSGAVMSVRSSVPMPAVSTGTLTIGEKDAPVTMLLFMNHDCAYCRDMEEELLPRLFYEFTAQGKLKIHIIPIPLQKYPDSDRNARLLLCAVRSGSGDVVVHRQLFEGVQNVSALTDCMKDEAFLQKEMAAQHELIRTFDVTLVPTYVINGQKFVGLPNFADLRGQITEALER
jgi:protein-disulfide isomerase